MKSLIRSVSGMRGIYGQGLTRDRAVEHAAAFARLMAAQVVVVGRDARTSGPDLLDAVTEGLGSEGCRALDLGACATPAVQVAVEEAGCDGGLVLTASHNPAPWNGIKFISRDGTFLGPGPIQELFADADTRQVAPRSRARIKPEAGPNAIAWQVAAALRIPEVEPLQIKTAGLKVVVDGCRSVGGLSTVLALRELGVLVVELDCEPDGQFTRGLEPLPRHLGKLCDKVRDNNASFGIAHDPDGDRAALVDETGRVMGEEFTLVIAVERLLSRRKGPVVINLSTSRMAEDVAASQGVPLYRSPVGEIHVVDEMKRRAAIVGGEGNGGVIVPDAHYGRDGTVAAVLVALHLAITGRPLSDVRRRLGRYTMKKEKLENVSWQSLRTELDRAFPDAEREDRDGLRFSWPDRWLHVRPSGTEPITRLIAEAGSEERLAELVSRARSCALGAATPHAGEKSLRSSPKAD